MELTKLENKHNSKTRNLVLKALTYGPKTLRELEKATETNYTSVRLAVSYLVDSGELARVGNGSKNVPYRLAKPEETASNTMPILVDHRGNYKLILFLDLRTKGLENIRSAVENLPMHITRILRASMRASNDPESMRKETIRIKKSMTQDRDRLLQIASYYTQMIENDLIWDVSYLQTFVDDKVFNVDEVNKSINHYFKTED